MKQCEAMMEEEKGFNCLPEDVLLNILINLEDDPRHLPRLACVSTKFASLIRSVCWRNKCYASIPHLVSHLLSSASSSPPGGWPALHKLAVCCPGLLHSGVLLDNSDFGLDRELGPEHNFPLSGGSTTHPESSATSAQPDAGAAGSNCGWSLYDDLYMDTVYDASEFQADGDDMMVQAVEKEEDDDDESVIKAGCDSSSVCRKNKVSRSHLASGIWNLSREQGNKLLASRFRGDCLYICDWPGCVHVEEKRNYMLFRGIFKDFKRSRVWRTINDGNRSKVNLNCAYCPCKETWDLHSAFCLRRVYGYHDDGEPVVRAYVCENGHVSGAWTDWPLYT